MPVTETIVKIHDLFDGWRATGCSKLPHGVELIGPTGEGDEVVWLHALFPGLTGPELAQLQKDLGIPFPGPLRAFYRVIGGMTLFHGAFMMCGRRRPGLRTDSMGLQPGSIADLNHELDVLGWKPVNAVAFATNAWDQSVHLANMSKHPEEIVRCDRGTGRVLETHENIFQCIWERLYRLDQLMLR